MEFLNNDNMPAGFPAEIFKIGINPYVLVPQNILSELFRQAGKEKGPIPVRGFLNGNIFDQTLVKFRGKWRLYLNTPMRKAAGVGVGDKVRINIEFDPTIRSVAMPEKLMLALAENAPANAAFQKLSPYRRREIMRYINSLRSDESVKRNVERAIQHLMGKGRFTGRDGIINTPV